MPAEDERKRAPAFFRSWDSQRFGPVSDDFRQHPGRFLVVGFPKSGNVWLTSLIAGCLDVPVEPVGGRAHVEYTHKKLTKETLCDRGLLRGVVLVRDMRDIVVSLFHWLKTKDYLDYYKHGSHQIFYDIETMYIECFLRRFALLPWRDLVDGYVENGWPVVKYERLCDDAPRELRRLFAVWGISVDEGRIEDTVSDNSLDALRSGKGRIEKGTHRTHFRCGGYGHYATELPPNVLADMERRFGDYLSSWGYSIGNVP